MRAEPRIIFNTEELIEWRKLVRAMGDTLVVTNGCFDVLHIGHVISLQMAADQGDWLLVGINGDEAVECLKGPGRPITGEIDRATILSELRMVDAVYIFPEKTATNFLSLCSPDVYVKGGDYSLDKLNKDERTVLEQFNTKIVFTPTIKGKSTTLMASRIALL